jgi:hypothetical protein
MTTKSKKFKPYSYTKEIKGKKIFARATLKATGAGVYVIFEDNKTAYVGYSGSDVKKTLYRHFQKWNDLRHPENKRRSRIERVSYYKGFKNDDFKIQVYFCGMQEAQRLEIFLIKKLKPRDNNLKIEYDKEEAYYKKIESDYNKNNYAVLPDDFFY